MCGRLRKGSLMDKTERLLALKSTVMVPWVYRFYQRPPVLVRGEGALLFAAEGRRYLDCFSGVSVVNAGHCNRDILAAAAEQMYALQHTTTIYLTEPMLELARLLAELAPGGLRRSFFCASGSEAPEGAPLLAALGTGPKELVYLPGALHVQATACNNA